MKWNLKLDLVKILNSFIHYKHARLFLGISLFLLLPAFFIQKIDLFILYLLPIYLGVKRYGLIHNKNLIEKIKSFLTINNQKSNILDYSYLLITFIPLIIYVISLFISQEVINDLLIIIASFLLILIVSEFIATFVIKLIRDEEVTYEIIIGSISIYSLLGIIWFFMYLIAYLLDNSAFYTSFFDLEKNINLVNLLYFSFTTLTTVGYGDIIPVNFIAKIITNFEGIVGVMFPAVFIARLLGNLKPNR